VLLGRNIRKSARDRVVDLFESPPVESELNPFNVYTEVEYRDDTFIPPQDRAFIYVISARILPSNAAKYPVVVIDLAERRWQSEEMGNRKGGIVTLDFECFGRNTGESNDIADFIARFMGTTLPIRDYAAANPSGTILEYAPILEPIDIDAMEVMAESVQFTGAVLAWDRVRMKIMTLQ